MNSSMDRAVLPSGISTDTFRVWITVDQLAALELTPEWLGSYQAETGDRTKNAGKRIALTMRLNDSPAPAGARPEQRGDRNDARRLQQHQLLLPGGRLPLNIFEPRYLQMMEDVLRSGDRLIGMIQPIGEGLASIGTAGRISMFSENDDGRMMISLRAISRFRLVEVIEGFTPYLRGRVDWAPYRADLRAALRSGGGDAVLRDAIREAIARKPKGHDFDYSRGVGGKMSRNMSHTGG